MDQFEWILDSVVLLKSMANGCRNAAICGFACVYLESLTKSLAIQLLLASIESIFLWVFFQSEILKLANTTETINKIQLNGSLFFMKRSDWRCKVLKWKERNGVELKRKEKKKHSKESLDFNVFCSHFPFFFFRFHLRQFNWLDRNENRNGIWLLLVRYCSHSCWTVSSWFHCHWHCHCNLSIVIVNTFSMFSKMCSTFKIPKWTEGNRNQKKYGCKKTGTKKHYSSFHFISFFSFFSVIYIHILFPLHTRMAIGSINSL